MKMRTLAGWMRRVLVTLVLLWGTIAALVAFAVRYELGPFTPPGLLPATQPQDISADGIVRSRLPLAQWSEAAPVAEIIDTFRHVLEERQRKTGAVLEIDVSRVSMNLEFRLRDTTALWTVRYDGGCDCPYEQADVSNRFTALIDPMSAAVVGVSDSARLVHSSRETR